MGNVSLTLGDLIRLATYDVVRQHYGELSAESILPPHLAWARDNWKPAKDSDGGAQPAGKEEEEEGETVMECATRKHYYCDVNGRVTVSENGFDFREASADERELCERVLRGNVAMLFSQYSHARPAQPPERKREGA